ncbi:hypothetical protein [Massilia consociata]|uniref:Uncharacterized protein n=1 Tax=Massilia consociata TaxID=760117 RepID=A0ABV6FB04_9BURK
MMQPDAVFPRTDARRDFRQRDIVDLALALAPAYGTMSALEYLKSHCVDARVIARVLLEPGRRRSDRLAQPA